MKRNKGITLIALIITIIVLLILAGITLNMVMGENGIFKKANIASEETNKSQATEIMNLKIITAQMNSYAEKQTLPSLQELANILDSDNEIEYVHTSKGKYGSLADIDIGAATSIYTKLKEYPYEFEINSSLQLASIDGVKVATNPEGGSGNYESQLINDFRIKTDKVSAKNITINIDGTITTKDESSIAGYLIFINDKCITVTSNMPYTITNLEKNTKYKISVKAVDINGNLKGCNSIEPQTTNSIETILEYPIITKKGVVNVKYTNPNDSNDFEYGLDLTKDCTATDALDKAAYDGNDATYFDPSSGKCKFYFGSDIDLYQVCFKIDEDYNGYMYNAVKVSGIICVGEGKVKNGVFHTTYYGKNTTAWQNYFTELIAKTYEIYYDGNLE